MQNANVSTNKSRIEIPVTSDLAIRRVDRGRMIIVRNGVGRIPLEKTHLVGIRLRQKLTARFTAQRLDGSNEGLLLISPQSGIDGARGPCDESPGDHAL